MHNIDKRKSEVNKRKGGNMMEEYPCWCIIINAKQIINYGFYILEHRLMSRKLTGRKMKK